MASMNRVFLMGNVTSDPDAVVATDGTGRTTLRLAVDTRFRDRNDKERVETCYIDIVTWGSLAKACYENLQEGSRILVEGRLFYSEWKDKETGRRMSKISVKAARVQFLDRKKVRPGAPATTSEGAAQGSSDQDDARAQPAEDSLPYVEK